MTCRIPWIVSVLLAGSLIRAEDRLPGTDALEPVEDRSAAMVAGIHKWLDRKIAACPDERRKLWKYDLSSIEAYEKSVEPHRQRLKSILGVVDPRETPRMERFGDDDSPALVAETPKFKVWQVRWPVLEGVTGEGLLLEPTAPVMHRLIALPDADQTPEQLVGLAAGIAPEEQWVRVLLDRQAMVLVPTLISREAKFSGNAAVAFTNQPHREWIYRQAFELGRHVIGYELQKVLAAADWFQQRKPGPVGVLGYGEGGLIAMYAAAIDPRFDPCFVSGCFGPPERMPQHPIYRNVWGLLREFGDAEVASMIQPRRLLIEYSREPAVTGPPAAQGDQRPVAAPGKLETPAFADLQAEFRRLPDIAKVAGAERTPMLLANPDDDSAAKIGSQLSLLEIPEVPAPLQDRRKSFDPVDRQRRQVKELEQHVQLLISRSERVRDAFFLNKADRSSAEAFARDAAKFRQHFHEEVLGKLNDARVPPRPRSKKFKETERWTAYDVVLDVWPDVVAWGLLLVPKDLQPGEKRPVVVCQHGLEGLPEDTIAEEGPGFGPYRAFAARLAERGFITFAPHNPYRGKEHYRSLHRKLNPLKASLYSVIFAQHSQVLDWLATQPFVDPDRIGFYGLSYGGSTAMRIPPLIERYKLSICSAAFNDWIRKTAGTEYSFCYPYHPYYEIPEWNLGHTFNNAEMAYLMVPRPFMVERGHHDGVSVDSWVAWEYAKIRWLYAQLGIGETTGIEYFNGDHWINGQGTYEFLHKHLEWPKR